jgi:uncharacterized repeat protein (TIGR02543 family)
VTLTATPATGWSFSGWSGSNDLASTTANPTTITMNGNETVTATFTQIKYTLTVQIIGQGSVTASPQQSTYASGTVVTLIPTPATGWSFSGWSGSNDLASNSANPTTIAMNDNETVTAAFILTSPNVKIHSVTLPSGAETSGPWIYTLYPTTFTLVNNESVNVTVTWQAFSSVTGNFDSGSVTVPANGSISVTKSYYYTVGGAVNLTYTIYYNGAQINSWSGTMNVLP